MSKDKVTIVEQDDVKYLLKIDSTFVHPNSSGETIVVAIIEENEDAVSGPIVENAEAIGLVNGKVIGCPQNMIQVQIDEGIIERVETEEYYS